MKTFLLLTLSLITASAQFANAKAEDQDQAKHPKKQQHAQSNRPVVIPQAPKFQRSNTVHQQVPVSRAPHVKPVMTNQTPKVRSFDQDAARTYRPNRNPDPMPRIRPNQDVVTAPQTTATLQAKVDARKRSDWENRNRTDKNWHNRVSNNNSNNNSWEEARRRHHRNHHDRSWWRSHFSRFALFGSGYYFWDNGYWYPAYGYDRGYNSYSYDEPIYGYNDLDPAQVISSVQTKLQRLGYYRYAVDGQMGPATRAAIANYQRDTGLSITAAIDGPTLQSLGLG